MAKFDLNTYRLYPYNNIKLPKTKGNLIIFYSPIDFEMYGESRLRIPLDIHADLEDNEVLIIFPSDEIATNLGITLSNGCEIIDGAMNDGIERNIILKFMKSTPGYTRILANAEIAKGIIIKYSKKRGK